ncbi:hypothetical protein EXN66_Car016147 [Channa argus]|uniref:Uncharacterized protein n=1 Tax=Channa argus TaxID=215402 RepID=A0A6G1QCR3_CHAAH|nr:hypothetical protein EXN66_Car016147 [Channa argus]
MLAYVVSPQRNREPTLSVYQQHGFSAVLQHVPIAPESLSNLCMCCFALLHCHTSILFPASCGRALLFWMLSIPVCRSHPSLTLAV